MGNFLSNLGSAVSSSLGGLAGALPSMASGIASNVMNKRQADRAMRDNWAMNTIHNDMAEAFFNADLAHQWDMWNANNQYNTPKAQKQRMLEAGLNPYTNSLNAGNSQGIGSGHGSVPSAIAMTPAMKQPVFNQYLGNLTSDFFRIQEQKADVQGKNIDNQYRSMKNTLDLARTIADIHGLNSRTKGQLLSNAFDAMSFNSRLALANQQPGYMKQQIEGLILDNEMRKANLRWVDKEKEAQVRSTIATSVLAYAQAHRIKVLTPVEMENIVSKTFLQNKQNWNLPIRNKADADRYADAYIRGAESAADLAGSNANIRANDLFMSNRDRDITNEGDYATGGLFRLSRYAGQNTIGSVFKFGK